MKTPSSKYVPVGPVMAASHSKKFSSVVGPAAMPEKSVHIKIIDKSYYFLHRLGDSERAACVQP